MHGPRRRTVRCRRCRSATRRARTSARSPGCGSTTVPSPPCTTSKRRCSGTEFTADVLAGLRDAYGTGAGMADAFGRWLERVLGSHGLVVYDAADPAAKPLVADLFRREIEHAGETAQLAAAAGAALTERGYHAQVTPAGRQCRAVPPQSAGASRFAATATASWSATGPTRPRRCSSRCALRPRRSARTCCCARWCRTRSSPRSVTSPARASWPIWASCAACMPPSASRCRSSSRAPRPRCSTPTPCAS